MQLPSSTVMPPTSQLQSNSLLIPSTADFYPHPYGVGPPLPPTQGALGVPTPAVDQAGIEECQQPTQLLTHRYGCHERQGTPCAPASSLSLTHHSAVGLHTAEGGQRVLAIDCHHHLAAGLVPVLPARHRLLVLSGREADGA